MRNLSYRVLIQMKPKHILESQQFDRSNLEELFSSTDALVEEFNSREGRNKLQQTLQGRLMFALFYEPSTRTRFSFCAAAHHLGMRAIQTENASEFSSAVKGETLEDSIRVLCEYSPDVIVLRHNDDGSSNRAAKVVNDCGYNVPIINAGDGGQQHPTQALLDLYTIRKQKKRIDGHTVLIGGDLRNGRTGRSLVYLMAKYKNVNFIFLSPENLRMNKDILRHLDEHDIAYRETEDFHGSLKEADVIYWTRVQKERGSTNTTLELTLTAHELKIMKEDAIILHPLPRNSEISKVVDTDKRAVYFSQAGNGVFIRMALLKKVCT